MNVSGDGFISDQGRQEAERILARHRVMKPTHRPRRWTKGIEMATTTDLRKGLTRTDELLEHLIDDVYKSFEVLDSEKESQYLRRVAVRTVFSFIEGIVQILKFELNRAVRFGYSAATLSTKEYETLYEVKIEDGEKINIIIPIDQNLRRTFKLASKIWNLGEYKFNTNSEQHTYFKYAKETRNKLTHPRTFYDIEISANEMSYVAHAFEWVRQEFVRLHEDYRKSLRINFPPKKPETVQHSAAAGE